MLNKIRICRTVTRNGVNRNALIPRTQYFAVGGIVCIRSDLACRIQSDLSKTLGIRFKLIGQSADVNECTFNGLAVFVRNFQLKRIPYNRSFGRKRIIRLHGNGYGGQTEAVCKVACVDRFKGARDNAVGEFCSVRQRFGNVECHKRYRIA